MHWDVKENMSKDAHRDDMFVVSMMVLSTIFCGCNTVQVRKLCV